VEKKRVTWDTGEKNESQQPWETGHLTRRKVHLPKGWGERGKSKEGGGCKKLEPTNCHLQRKKKKVKFRGVKNEERFPSKRKKREEGAINETAHISGEKKPPTQKGVKKKVTWLDDKITLSDQRGGSLKRLAR